MSAWSRWQVAGCREADPDGDQALKKVCGEDEVAPFLAKHAQSVRGADVAAALLAQIHTLEASNEMTTRNGTNQISSKGYCGD